MAEVAKLMADAGQISARTEMTVSFISPFRSERSMARDSVEKGEFLEIFVDAPIAVCEVCNPKGLYAKMHRGEIMNFTGINSPYEPPNAPELRVDTTTMMVDLATDPVGRLLD